MKTLKTYSLILTAYLFLAVAFTWPLTTKITSRGFGHDEDAPYHLWHNWWLKFSLFDLKQNPLQTDYIFHPQKINLIYDANAFVFSALTLPFQLITGNVVLSSNIAFLLSFALSGLTAFLLTNYLVPHHLVTSFIAGLIFAFNPFTTAQAIDGHINLTSTWLIPIYTLFLLKSLKGFNPLDQSLTGFNKIRPYYLPILTGIVASFQLYNDFTYTAFLIIETGLIFAFYFYQNLMNQRRFALLVRIIKAGVLIVLSSAFLASPLLWEIYRASKTGIQPGSPLWVQNVWSADLLSFIRPNDQTTFLPNPWTPDIGTVEGTAFVGYTIISLIVGGTLWLKFKRKNASGLPENVGNVSRERFQRHLVPFLALAFFLLLLGPSLHYKNNFQFKVFGLWFIFPLPYLLLHKIPFIGETQEPARLFPFFILALSIVTAYLLKEITQRVKIRILAYSLLVLTTLFIIIEYLPVPFPTTDLSPQPIFDIIRRDPEKKAVLILPLGFNSGNYVLGPSPLGSLQFYQVYHQKPSFRATVARLPYSNFEYYQKLPLIPYLINPEGKLKPGDTNPNLVRRVFKDELHIKYVVVFEKKYRQPLGQTYEILENVLGAKKFYDQGFVKGYLLE